MRATDMDVFTNGDIGIVGQSFGVCIDLLALLQVSKPNGEGFIIKMSEDGILHWSK